MIEAAVDVRDRLRVETTPESARAFLNDVEIRGVRAVTTRHQTGRDPVVTLELSDVFGNAVTREFVVRPERDTGYYDAEAEFLTAARELARMLDRLAAAGDGQVINQLSAAWSHLKQHEQEGQPT